MEYSKYTTTAEQLEVKCRREYIDFNGLGDYATLHAAIREISPKHVITWHGGQVQRAFLTKRLEEDRQYMSRCGGRSVQDGSVCGLRSLDRSWWCPYMPIWMPRLSFCAHSLSGWKRR